MTSLIRPTHPLGERELALLALYHPPVRLRKHHKDLLKTIWSFAQGFDGSKLSCFSCKAVFSFKDATVHHNDGIESHNDFDNLSPACYSCNYTEGWLVRRRKVSEERERMRRASVEVDTILPYSSEEGARSEKMRPRFDRWAYDPNTGIVSTSGSRSSVKGLARLAVHGVGPVRGKLGAAQTYEKYVREDVAGGIWRQPDLDDLDLIERTGKSFPFPEARAR